MSFNSKIFLVGILFSHVISFGAEKPKQDAIASVERQRAERRLFESEYKHRAILDAAQVGIYVLVDGQLRYVNPAFADSVGTWIEPSTRFSSRSALPTWR